MAEKKRQSLIMEPRYGRLYGTWKGKEANVPLPEGTSLSSPQGRAAAEELERLLRDKVFQAKQANKQRRAPYAES
jgi:hypothetical protein